MFDRHEHMWAYGHPWGGHPWGEPWGHDWWPGMLLSTLNNLLWIALIIGLAWVLLRLISPFILPALANIFGVAPTDSPLEILRQRFAAGEIDAITFEQMCERLEASYRRESDGIPPSDNVYSRETWTGYRDPSAKAPVIQPEDEAPFLL